MKKSLMVSGMNFATEFINGLYKAVVKLGGNEEQMFDALKTGSEFISKCAELIVQKKDEAVEKILSLISSGESVVIDAVDGTETLANAKDVFVGYVDSDFRKYGTDEKGEGTGETSVNIYEMVQNSMF